MLSILNLNSQSRPLFINGDDMRRKLKAKIFEVFGTQEELCSYIKDKLGYSIHYSKLSRFINEYGELTDQEKNLITQALGVKERDASKLFTGDKKNGQEKEKC